MRTIKEKVSLFLALAFGAPWVYFRKELALIKDEGVAMLVKETMSNIYGRNFTGPASSSGKYHPAFDRGYGGTARHTKAVVLALTAFQGAYPDKDWDCIYAAALLHDLAKYEKGNDHSNKNHATVMMNRVHRLVKGNEEILGKDHSRVELIARLIGAHMGRWEKKAHLLPKGFFETDEAKLLHMADMIVSRKWYGTKVIL